jgi:hypothetical protein
VDLVASLTLVLASLGGLVGVVRSVKNLLQRQDLDSAEVERLQEALAEPVIPDDVAPTLSMNHDGDGEQLLLPGLDWVSEVAQRRAKVYVEHHQAALRQQRAAFWSSLTVGALGLVLIIVGIAFALFGTTEVGVLTSVSSLLPGAASALLFNQSKAAGTRADENLERLTASVERAEAVQTCIQVATGLRHEPTRDRIVAIASLLAAFPGGSLQELSAIVASPESE